MKLKPGKKAPPFIATDQNGHAVALSDFKGKKVVIFFYPEDDTPTCTKQACGLRDHYQLLTEKGIVLLGVSPDSEKSHKKFEKKYKLPYTMLADPEKKILNKYGVWAEKTLFGRTYMGTRRNTFLINEEGRIDHIIEKVDSKNHAQQILDVWNL